MITGSVDGVIEGVVAEVSSGVQRGVVDGVAGAVRSRIEGRIKGGIGQRIEKAVSARTAQRFATAVSGGAERGIVGSVDGGAAEPVAGRQQDQQVHHVSEEDVVGPRVLQKVDPDYTQAAKDAKIEGPVVVDLEVHPDGRAHNLRIRKSLDPGLDRNALDAISKWEFAPATKKGEPVVVVATIEVNFRLQ